MSTNTNERQQQQQQSLSQGVGKQASTFYTRPIVNPKLEEMDVIPEGATQEEFNSRPIVVRISSCSNVFLGCLLKEMVLIRMITIK
mmetsp:Transcript_62334/g.92592  ORF Transcript_62334/g.92592 Transcript_62334/m.92592 type:complete len:86 (+) Transcript_62334:99-356(+)